MQNAFCECHNTGSEFDVATRMHWQPDECDVACRLKSKNEEMRFNTNVAYFLL
jgi:hypothetical protein